MKVHFLRIAEMELDSAIEQYESVQPELGFHFLSEVQQSLKRIKGFPESYTPIGKYSRRCLVRTFPYSVIYQYRKNSNEILVVAIAHLHRNPEYWLHRES